MKRIILALAAALAIAAPSRALSPDEAARRATYLTTMMIADLALPEQYRQEVYMANLDYIMGLNSYGDLYAQGWKARNRRLRNIMRRQQWDRYVATRYYRPVGWGGSGIVFYFGAPAPPPPPRHHHDFDDDDYEDYLEDMEDHYKHLRKQQKKARKRYEKAVKHHQKSHGHKKHRHHDDDDD